MRLVPATVSFILTPTRTLVFATAAGQQPACSYSMSAAKEKNVEGVAGVYDPPSPDDMNDSESMLTAAALILRNDIVDWIYAPELFEPRERRSLIEAFTKFEVAKLGCPRGLESTLEIALMADMTGLPPFVIPHVYSRELNARLVTPWSDTETAYMLLKAGRDATAEEVETLRMSKGFPSHEVVAQGALTPAQLAILAAEDAEAAARSAGENHGQ